MKKFFFPLFLLVFLAVGCTQKISAGNEVSINNFFSDMNEIESERSVYIYMDIENFGDSPAVNTEASLMGGWLESPDKKYLSILSPVNRETNSPGGFSSFEWKLKAPQIPQGTTKDYDFTGRVEYDYSTSAAAEISVMNEDEYERKRMLGELGGSVETTNTNAPIKISVDGDYPLKVSNIIEKASNRIVPEKTFYRIYFRNAGSGLPVTSGINGKIEGKIKIKEPTAMLSCLGQNLEPKTGAEISLKNFVLREGSDEMISCSVDIDREKWKNRPQGIVTLLFELRYRYYTDSQTVITIKGEKSEPIKA